MATHNSAITGRYGVTWDDANLDADFDYASLSSPESRREYFQQNGYVVRPGLIEKDICDQAALFFVREVKPYGGCLYRQASANPEKHELNIAGNVINPLLNPLSINGRLFPSFRAASEKILSCDALFTAIREIYAEPAVLVQSMYFEGNPGTWPHQDSYYLDADTPGRLTGAWIALEDIDERAGRFYVLPGSQRVSVGSNAGNLSIGVNHDLYKQRIHDYVQSRSRKIRAPILRCGDVLLWSSRTIHGASMPADPSFSRHSYTAHFIPASARFVQYECISKKVKPVEVDGNSVCRPKDQNRLLNRWMLGLEACSPKLFPRLKKAAIARKIKRLASRRPS